MDSAPPQGDDGEPAVSVSDHEVANLGAPVIDSLSLDETLKNSGSLSFNMVQNTSTKQSTEDRKKDLIEQIMEDETKKMLRKEASKPGYLKGTVSTDADTRFESLSEQNHKRTYESFRVTKQELKNSSSPMKRASVRKENKGEAGQQLKVGPNARIREERFRKQLMRTKAELKAEQKLRQEFEEKVAYLEGKVKGMELALNREKKVVRRLQEAKSGVDPETKIQEQLLRSQAGNSKKDGNAIKDPRHVEVLKDRLKDALYEAEKQRLEVRSKNEELSRAYQTIKNLEHIIDSVRNNHTFKTLTGNKKKGMAAKGSKSRFGVEKHKVNATQSIDKAKSNTHSKKRPSPRGRNQQNSIASRSPRRNKSKSPLRRNGVKSKSPRRRDGVKSKSPRQSPRRNQGKLDNNRKAHAKVPLHSPKKRTNSNNKGNEPTLKRTASQNTFEKKRNASNYRDRRLENNNSKSDSSLNAPKKQTGGNHSQNNKKKRMSQQSFLDHKNKRKPVAQQHRRYPRLQPIHDQEHEHFITVDTSKIKPMVGQMEGKMAKEQKAALQAHRRSLAQQHIQQRHDIDTDEDASTYSREESRKQKDQNNDGSVVVASNGNVMLPQSIKAFAFGSHDGTLSENATSSLEKEFEF
eukprot:g3504.t1